VIDQGARCRAHEGEVFLVRCGACLELNMSYRVFGITASRAEEVNT
jgi:hypothetical protein